MYLLLPEYYHEEPAAGLSAIATSHIPPPHFTFVALLKAHLITPFLLFSFLRFPGLYRIGRILLRHGRKPCGVGGGRVSGCFRYAKFYGVDMWR